MFTNIGSKIKTLASVFTWLGIIGSIISGIYLASQDDDLILIGLLTALLGSLFSWIGSFLLYGFGQLIENSDILVNVLANRQDTALVNAASIQICEEKRIPDGMYCPLCDKQLSFSRKYLMQVGKAVCPYCQKDIVYNPPKVVEKKNFDEVSVKKDTEKEHKIRHLVREYIGKEVSRIHPDWKDVYITVCIDADAGFSVSGKIAYKDTMEKPSVVSYTVLCVEYNDGTFSLKDFMIS